MGVDFCRCHCHFYEKNIRNRQVLPPIRLSSLRDLLAGRDRYPALKCRAIICRPSGTTGIPSWTNGIPSWTNGVPSVTNGIHFGTNGISCGTKGIPGVAMSTLLIPFALKTQYWVDTPPLSHICGRRPPLNRIEKDSIYIQSKQKGYEPHA